MVYFTSFELCFDLYFIESVEFWIFFDILLLLRQEIGPLWVRHL